MKDGLISVVIPTRNRAAFLRKALDSVYAQTFQNFEIIVVDDGSQDDTGRIAGYYDQRLKYIFQRHKGVSAARNTGISSACGEYVAFLDDDDIFTPRKLQRNAEYLSQNPEIIWLCSGFSFIGADDRLLPGRSIMPEKAEVTLHDIAMFMFIHTSSVVARRKSLEAAGGFPEGIRVSEDYHMWARLLRNGGGAALPESLTLFRRHKGNTRLPFHALLKENTKVIDYILQTGAPCLLPREAYIRNLHRIVGDSLLYKKKFLQYICFNMWRRLF